MEVSNARIRVPERSILVHNRNNVCHKDTSGFDERESAMAKINSGTLHGSCSTIVATKNDSLPFPKDLAHSFKHGTSICALIRPVWTDL